MLKCSHTFNILDTRGAVGVTERAGYFRRMRSLSRRIAEAYIAQRERLEFPWLGETTADDRPQTAVRRPSSLSVTTTVAPFLLEIGTEELPPRDLEDGMAQLRARVPQMLDDLRLAHGEVKVYGTPRRLVVHVEDLAPRQADLEETVKGPPAARAFDAAGNPTKAAEGFARSKGVAVSELEVREVDGGEYVVAVVRREGKPAVAVLTDALAGLVAGLHFVKTMRWNSSNAAFSRPVRWLLALHGEQVIPLQYAGLTAGNRTRGLRFVEPETIEVASPQAYFDALRAQGILLDPGERCAEIERQIHALAAETGGEILDDPDLLLEVTHLVEAPSAVLGEFEPGHLELPREVLISVMRKHQRYFPLQKDGRLLPRFITVANKPHRADADYSLIRRGNEDVIRARFTDAAYFVREDRKHKLEDFLPKLEKLTFQADLGSMLDKTRRIERLTAVLAPQVGLTPDEQQTALRAAQLCKADLATQMVVEMTSLQGVMGREYALHSGESEAVAVAIFEHYLPRSADDAAPTTKPGLLVGLADRLDSLVGLFAVGLVPTGNKDPFALRRAALGLVGNLIVWSLPFDLRAAVEAAAENLPLKADQEAQQNCLTFIAERLRNIFLDQGYPHDVVDAIIAAQGHDPARAAVAVEQLSQWVKRKDWETILPAYARCVRITRTVDGGQRSTVNPELFEHDSERALWDALQTAEAAERAPGSVDDFLNALVAMIPAIDRFFEDVLVMAEDEAVRENRLALLRGIAALADGVADMSRLEGF